VGDAGEAEAKVPVVLFCRASGRFGAPSRQADVCIVEARPDLARGGPDKAIGGTWISDFKG
jgi:hypothetical protein